jgi:hypothetical protein
MRLSPNEEITKWSSMPSLLGVKINELAGRVG